MIVPDISCLPTQVQTSLSHVTCDGLRRITVGYSPIIEADWLHNRLTLQHESSDIEVHSITGAVYKIKLSRCYEVLSRMPWQPGARLFALDDLVHNRRISSGAWLECMVPVTEDGEFVSLSLLYTIRRATYTNDRNSCSNTPTCQTGKRIYFSP